ncbi:MAG: leucine-rich repeat protein [Lachnospiraceae bacterium]|nr:leucine-rich repeat protein [Lachnospiraceae bacterium]
MKKRRKTISFLLAISLALGLSCSVPFDSGQTANVQAAELQTPTGDTSGTCGAQGNNIQWELIIDPDGTIYQDESDTASSDSPVCYELHLTGTGDMNQDLFSAVTSPWYNYRKHITSISIGEGITSVCNYAFYEHCSLVSVTLPDSTASVGRNAFELCYSLKTFTCGKGLKQIKDLAFNYLPSLSEIQFNDGLEVIGAFAFQHCEALKSISLPDSLKSISQASFAELPALTEIQFGEGLEDIGGIAFQNCSALKSIVLPKSLISIKESAFAGLTSLTDLQLNDGLQEIRVCAFSGCRNLTDLSLPESLTSIGAAAFSGTQLTNITIPQKLEEIQSGAFGQAPLKTIQVNEGNPRFFVQDNILYEKREDGTPKRAVAYTISDSAASVALLPGTELIDGHAFNSAKNLTSIQLPDTLTEISPYAFISSGLTELNLPDSVKTIGSYAFSNCWYLPSLTIPDNLETLGYGAFSTCSALKNVVIGKSLQDVESIFIGGTSLETISVSQDNPYLKSSDNVVYSADGTRLSYYAALKPNASYHVQNQVKSIAGGAIMDTACLEKLYLPASLESLETYSIFSNQNLNAIYFLGNGSDIQTNSYGIAGNSKKLILYKTAESAGWDAAPWTSYTIADWDPANTEEDSGSFETLNWEYIGSDGSLTFTGTGQIPDFTADSPAPWSSYTPSIQTIEGNGITSIGDYSFSNASKLIRLETGADLERIGNYAFSDCGSLKSLNIAAITDIGSAAFQNNVSIAGSLTLEKVSSIGEGAFQGCTKIASATLGSRLGILEKEVFAGCAGLASFIIPDSVYEIREGAFRDCKNLRSINIPNDVYLIGSQAFAGNTALERVYFGGTIPGNWASDSFDNCSGSLNLCHRAAQTSWNRLEGNWNGVPLLKQDRFYTDGQDHYSFANAAESFGYPAGYRFLKRRFVETLGDISLGTYYYVTDRGWNGSCYGMAGSALEFYENQDLSPTDYGAPYNSLYAIQAPGNKDASITKLIESYQISQYHPIISGCGGSISRHRNDYRGLVQKVEEFERSGGLRIDSKAEPVILLLYSAYSGHAAIPVSVMQDADGNFQIKAYNPDHPSELETLTINKDFSGISGYLDISYVPYNDLAASLSGANASSGEKDFSVSSLSGANASSGEKDFSFSSLSGANASSGEKDFSFSSLSAGNSYSERESSLYLSIDKEYGSVTDAEGRGISEIEGAYEQKPLSSEHSGNFSGVKSFVLPEGNYQLTADAPEGTSESSNPDSISFYLGTEEYFAKITSSDEAAVLNITENGTKDGSLAMELQSGSQGEETASFTLVNAQGMERTVEVGSSNAAITIEKNNDIAIQAPGQTSILLDGQETLLLDGQAASSFVAAQQENPLKASLLEKEVVCDSQNKLNGSLQAEVISNAAGNKEVTVTAEFLEKGKTAALYTKNDTLTPGLNHVSLSFEQLESAFQQTEGTLALSLRFTVTDEAGNTASFSNEDISVTLTKQPDSGSGEPDKDDSDDNKPDKDNSNGGKPDINNPSNSGGQKPGNGSSGKPDSKPNSNQNSSGSATSSRKREVTGIKTDVKKLTLGLGETYALKATALPANASDRKLRYTASNKKIAVSTTGKITAKKTGSSRITIQSSNGKTAVVQVTVKKKPGKIKLNAKTKTIRAGWKFQIKAKFPKGTASHKLTYSSNRKSVATVSSTGKVTAKKKGIAMITVKTYNGKKAKMKIIVTKK